MWVQATVSDTCVVSCACGAEARTRLEMCTVTSGRGADAVQRQRAAQAAGQGQARLDRGSLVETESLRETRGIREYFAKTNIGDSVARLPTRHTVDQSYEISA